MYDETLGKKTTKNIILKQQHKGNSEVINIIISMLIQIKVKNLTRKIETGEIKLLFSVIKG